MLLRTTTTALAAIATLMTAVPVIAQTCPELQPAELLGKGLEVRIARPEGREMCFTLAKSAGIAAGRVTILTIRPVLNASASDVEVLVTKERSARKGTRAHNQADLSTPDFLGSARIFVNADEDRHLTVRVRPHHGRDYRLAVIAHEIDIAELIGTATVDAFAHIALDIFMREMGGKDKALPDLDHRLLKIALKAISGTIKGHSAEEIVAGIAIQTAIKEMLAGADVPREVAIIVATFVTHTLREVTKSAVRPFQWTLPDDVRDTSQPLAAALRN